MAHAFYLDLIVRPDELKATVDWISDIIETKFPDVQYIAATGMSGIFCAGAVCARTGKAPFLIRKPGDNTHSKQAVEFPEIFDIEIPKTAVIIDDFICEGGTIKGIISTLKSRRIEPIGIILYDDYQRDIFKKSDIPIFPRETE